MQIEKTIKEYLKGLEVGSYEHIIKLFSPDAVVHSPLYSDIKAKKFYQNLFEDTSKSKINLINIFVNPKKPQVAAGHFHYDWILKDGTSTSFECVDIFQFTQNGKIKELTIIYDTSKIKTSFENMKNSTAKSTNTPAP